MSAAQIRQRLESILAFMQPHWELVNCHMVNYLTDGHWNLHVPADLRAELPNQENVRRCIEALFWKSNAATETESNKKETSETVENGFPAVFDFLNFSAQQRLDNFPEILTTLEELHKALGIENDAQAKKMSVKEFMSEKKRHEVEVTAELIDDLIQQRLKNNSDEEIFIIDAGDGKGYLSSRLALQYGHKVLGIDSNEANTKTALERSKKLQRAWSGLTERAELETRGITPPRRGKKPKPEYITTPINQKSAIFDNYKTTSKFITPELDMVQLLGDFFPVATDTTFPTLCLTGLHTCGNLAATCLQVFHAQTQCRMLCNIGCCYHLLKEAHAGPEYFGNKVIMAAQSEVGFPLSRFLREEKRALLGRNARMLAAQSIERTLAAKELPNVSLFYRALLEVLICEQDPTLKDTIQVGKIRKFSNFNEYLQLCEKKVPHLNLKTLPPTRIAQLEADYAADKCFLDLFYLLRMSFAPILESLILLDRLLFLKELGYEQSYLISVFDAVISPRHFGIVALKN